MARVLSFRAERSELSSLDGGHLLVGLACTWLVGMGRYWDDPSAPIVQRLGLGSVVYVFALAVFLWLILWPLRPASWSYFRVLTFVTLVSPPAALYAIPVERWVSISAARTANVYFLGIVAIWRVALLLFFTSRLGQLAWWKSLVGSLLPLAIIVTVLTTLNLDRVVFDVMAGIREPSRNVHADSYFALFVVTFFSMIASPVLFVAYVAMVIRAQLERRRNRRAPAPGLLNS